MSKGFLYILQWKNSTLLCQHPIPGDDDLKKIFKDFPLFRSSYKFDLALSPHPALRDNDLNKFLSLQPASAQYFFFIRWFYKKKFYLFPLKLHYLRMILNVIDFLAECFWEDFWKIPAIFNYLALKEDLVLHFDKLKSLSSIMLWP